VIPSLGAAVGALAGVLDTLQRQAIALTGLRSLGGVTRIGYALGAVSAVGYVVDVVTGSRRDTDDPDRAVDRSRGGDDGRRYLRAFTAIIVVRSHRDDGSPVRNDGVRRRQCRIRQRPTECDPRRGEPDTGSPTRQHGTDTGRRRVGARQ
jgi:hypothetical protein